MPVGAARNGRRNGRQDHRRAAVGRGHRGTCTAVLIAVLMSFWNSVLLAKALTSWAWVMAGGGRGPGRQAGLIRGAPEDVLIQQGDEGRTGADVGIVGVNSPEPMKSSWRVFHVAAETEATPLWICAADRPVSAYCTQAARPAASGVRFERGPVKAGDFLGDAEFRLRGEGGCQAGHGVVGGHGATQRHPRGGIYGSDGCGFVQNVCSRLVTCAVLSGVRAIECLQKG